MCVAGGIMAGLISDYINGRATTCCVMLILAAPVVCMISGAKHSYLQAGAWPLSAYAPLHLCMQLSSAHMCVYICVHVEGGEMRVHRAAGESWKEARTRVLERDR